MARHTKPEEKNLPLKIVSKLPKRKFLSKLPILICLTFGCIFLFINYAFPFLQDYFDYSIEVEPLMFNSLTNESEIWLDFCNLTDINPWDSTIMEFIKPEKDHMLNCIPKIFQYSKLINGQLFLYSNGTFKNNVEMGCEMRCLFPKSDWDLEYGNWIKVFNGTKPECDVIEVQCKKNDGKVYYTFFHAQVYRKIPPPSIPLEPSKKHDVHVIVLDAVSQTQFIRSMPKTLYFLREYYDAIPFKYLNKIGINSHPNGFAFLIGKIAFNLTIIKKCIL
uniref:Uncharacterized protein n=1 Tax=Panagrolaimus davidi TaxID=227884 RepID=A0A914NY97_9BILA